MPLNCLRGFKNVTSLPDPNTTDSKEKQLEQFDTGHDMWRPDRGVNIQTILDRLYQSYGWHGYEAYVQYQTNYPKGLSGQFEPELASFFEVQYNYPSLCESRKFGKVDWTISELMDDYNDKTFSDASNGPVKNQMITAIQLKMPTV